MWPNAVGDPTSTTTVAARSLRFVACLLTALAVVEFCALVDKHTGGALARWLQALPDSIGSARHHADDNGRRIDVAVQALAGVALLALASVPSASQWFPKRPTAWTWVQRARWPLRIRRDQSALEPVTYRMVWRLHDALGRTVGLGPAIREVKDRVAGIDATHLDPVPRDGWAWARRSLMPMAHWGFHIAYAIRASMPRMSSRGRSI
jgi:hypothetical protein